MGPLTSDNEEEIFTEFPAVENQPKEEAIKSRLLAQGSGTGLDADTLGRKRPSYFAASTGSATTSFSLLNGSLAGYIEGVEISDPSAPATNYGRLYFRDNGAGKTQLVCRFPTGAIQVIATEP